jgi:hypothetical protein
MSLLHTDPPNVPVKELRTQKDKRTIDALAVPHAKSATLNLQWLEHPHKPESSQLMRLRW